MTPSGLAELYRTHLIFTGTHIRLEPLRMKHAEELFPIAKDEEIWRWLYYAPPNHFTDMQSWVRDSLDAQALGLELPFAVIDKATGRAVGSSRYMNIERAHRSLEIG